MRKQQQRYSLPGRDDQDDAERLPADVAVEPGRVARREVHVGEGGGGNGEHVRCALEGAADFPGGVPDRAAHLLGQLARDVLRLCLERRLPGGKGSVLPGRKGGWEGEGEAHHEPAADGDALLEGHVAPGGVGVGGGGDGRVELCEGGVCAGDDGRLAVRCERRLCLGEGHAGPCGLVVLLVRVRAGEGLITGTLVAYLIHRGTRPASKRAERASSQQGTRRGCYTLDCTDQITRPCAALGPLLSPPGNRRRSTSPAR
ncbi:hypothetical protein CALCODRAFT_262036 [Calocera cornea HHB12733]|uniref:Uncharacterized protein n=1 Tax=Calocera cornea HHB12733 TaxID=1353952 RepID=A0A165GF03_9BASI|nr:hypothetical protein CALCODRAFT_262036 [Calocera cornea HHB12733]